MAITKILARRGRLDIGINYVLNGEKTEDIRFVFDCLKENTTQVRNMKQYLLAVLYNAPVTIENHYAALVNHDLYGKGTAALT